MKIAIVGAGTAGICAAKNCLQNGVDVTIYEQLNSIGGTWVYTNEIGKNSFGLNIHSSMYEGLRTNLPKEVMGFPDFPYSKGKLSYLPSEEVLEFLNLYADYFNVRNNIKFLHYVVRISPINNNKWEVLVRDLEQNQIFTAYYDGVMVCNGHYNTPKFPNIDGQDIFKGQKLHSHDYRNAKPMEDMDVLVIGAGPSGIDLTNEISKLAKRVILSHQSEKFTIFAQNVHQRPSVLRFHEDGAEFADGSYETFTSIMYCTGYQYTFPFLSANCGIMMDNNYVQPLYKHCININYPTMALIGLPFYISATSMMDIQCRFFLKFFLNQEMLPSKDEMIADMDRRMNERWLKGYKKRHAHKMGPEQADYFDDLAATANIQKIPQVVTKIHNVSSGLFKTDLNGFRNKIYTIVDDENFIISEF